MGIRTLIDFRNLENFRTPPGTLHLENVINLPLSLPCETPLCDKIKNNELLRGDAIIFMVGSINSIFYFLHKAAEPFNCLEQDNLA